MISSIRRKCVNTVKKIYPRLGLRDTDVILASFPRSGNTWIRFVWANIISLMEMDGREIDYALLDSIFDAEYDANSYGDLQCHSIPRFVKTHLEYEQRRFGRNRTLYIYRNPGDVMVSYYEYLSSLRNDPLKHMTFSYFIRTGKYGLEAWCRHFQSWLDYATVVISYESMTSNPRECFGNALKKLNIMNIPNEIISAAVERADFNNVRKIANRTGVTSLKSHWHKPAFHFARKGTINQWKDYFNQQDKAFLDNTLKDTGLENLEGI